MRPELTTLEQIDKYLSGDLPPTEHAAFESSMANDTDLASKVNEQKEIIRAVNRKALRAQINTVAAGGAASGGFSNLFLGVGGVVIIGLVVAGIVYYNSGQDELGSENEIAVIDNTVYSTVDTKTTNVDLYTDEKLIHEVPETIYSSINNYEELEQEHINSKVEVVTSVERNDFTTTNSGLIISEENDIKKTSIDIEEYDAGINKTAFASYPGGIVKMDVFIDKNLRYPKSAWNKSIEGVVRCDFLVTADGIISEIDAKCLKMSERDGPAFNDVKKLMNKKILNAFINNATHILRTMPTWVPAKNSQGNSILSAQRMYFNYDMENGCLVYQLDDALIVE